GSAAGRPEYDLFLYDRARGVLTNLTTTPAIDEGRPCVDVARGVLAYRTGAGEAVARIVDHGLAPLAHGPLPAFESCTWIDAVTLVGIERTAGGYRLHECRVANDAIACERRGALDGVDAVIGFARGSAPLTIIARRAGDMFRRSWVLRPPFD